MERSETLTEDGLPGARASRPAAVVTALVVLWSIDEPERTGEVLFVGDGGVFGRAQDKPGRLHLVQQQPGRNVPRGQPSTPRLSRDQLTLGRGPSDTLEVTVSGRCPVLLRDSEVQRARLSPGDVLHVKNQLVLLCARRPDRLEPIAGAPRHTFGAADADGIVGEGPAAWDLRRRIDQVAGRKQHVVVHGPSGSGKELVARAIHDRSQLRGGPLVARNAATVPEGLLDAELFGNVANYPNPGMRARPGLLGAADGGTLFLDEIGELAVDLQAHLLRVLDDGEYHRLGDAATQHARVRFIGATNRDLGSLKHDLLARLRLRVAVPGLDRRPEDVPLLARHLLQRMADEDQSLARFLSSTGEPRIAPELVEALVRHDWTTHVRELESVLWEAADRSPGTYLDRVPGLEVRRRQPPASATPDADAVRAALQRCDGVREQAWQDLGLSSRHALGRLMKKYGIRGP